MKNTIISIGGSVIYPREGINTQFLKEFSYVVRKRIAEDKNQRFFIIVGGGHVNKEYQYAAEQVVGHIKADDLDWLGVRATELNAHLIRTIFRDIARPAVIDKYDRRVPLGTERLVVCAGWRPGWSTDYDMVLLAKYYKISKVYSLINVPQIYDKDPRLYVNAKEIEKMTWSEYREMIGDWWDSKRQLPFDPFAAKLAQQIGLSVVFLYGKDLENFRNALNNKDFKGTTVTS